MRTPFLLLPLMLSGFLSAAESNDLLVRETEPLTAEQERAALHVPPEFEVQLFASEPMINKPINMAFDARGRLWVSSTVEYPYSADKSRWSDPQGTRVKDSRDAIKILEDTDGDGKADKVTDFADGLNIPTGVVPWHKPEHKAGCIAWSIPNIWYFADTDGDDKADVRQILFGPLGYEKDTHGMCSSFRLGLDGWVYATHGFNNTSHFKAKDGSSLELHSGNVFRFKPDGSTVERWTHGQVNPFGLCWDRYGNLYSADCHSSPIYQLIRGAHYPSFGKPHDGLGFAPVMCEHTHGSTGICGIVYLDGGVWGPEWDDHMLVGNPVTSKVNRDLVTFSGSTPKANERPDFITSDDPWFRPVDLQLGPDNALYVADFYNRIIGHYEVPLEHPGRDKQRGRIWRVVKKGSGPRPLVDFTKMNTEAIADELGSPNQLRRQHAITELIGRHDAWQTKELGELLSKACITPLHHASAQWIVARHNRTRHSSQDLLLSKYAARPEDAFNVVRSLSIDAARGSFDDKWAFLGVASLFPEMVFNHPFSGPHQRADPQIQLAVTKLLALATPEVAGNAGMLLLALGPFIPDEDSVLRHTTEIALRRIMSSETNFVEVSKVLEPIAAEEIKTHSDWAALVPVLANQRALFEKIALSIPQEYSAKWLHLNGHVLSNELSRKRARLIHTGARGSEELLPEVINISRKDYVSKDQIEILQSISDGLNERGEPAPPQLMAWAQELAASMLSDLEKKPQPSWAATASAKTPAWALKPRKCADGTEAQVLQSMSAGGGDEESRAGIMRSKEFAAPNQLSFWINGYNGFPNGKSNVKNLVRVVDAKDGSVLGKVFPPRNDVCQLAKMDLSKHAGKQVRLEIVDGDDGKAYAWLGITRIDPAVVSVDDFQTEDTLREGLKKLAVILQHSAPAALREKLAAYLPPRPAPPPLPVSPEQRKQLDALISSRVEAFAKAKPDVAKGKQVFQTNCAVCHRIGGEGGLIGPQLDGIGTRGAARLSEDILDPNRNVDAHFHVHTFTLKDGAVFSGFLKAEAGQVNILVDAAGKEHRVTKKDVEKSDVMPMSLMPPVFGQTVDEASFHHLLGYLLGK